MAWTPEHISKYNGKCRYKSKWQYCYYWRAKHSKRNKAVIGYKCALFNVDKPITAVDEACSECNNKYGRTYTGTVGGQRTI